MKKGQITIFFIVGFLLIGSFMLLVYLRQQTATKGLEKEIKTIAIDDLKINEIESFAQSCIDATFSNGLETLMKQGGWI